MPSPPYRPAWPVIVAATVAAATAGALCTRRHLKGQVRTWRELAERDPLTGLPNRRALIVEVQTRLAARSPFTLALIDLDDFKVVNDTWGHDTGDQLLVTVADRLRRATGPGGYAARLAGDEFVLLLPADRADPVGPVTTALDFLARPAPLRAVSLTSLASAGVAVSSGHSSWTDLISAADRALYQAKASGTQVVLARPGSDGGRWRPPTTGATRPPPHQLARAIDLQAPPAPPL